MRASSLALASSVEARMAKASSGSREGSKPYMSKSEPPAPAPAMLLPPPPPTEVGIPPPM